MKSSISVCMATFNGLPYLKDQIGSILPQLLPSDELVICDDGSTDGTRNVLADLAKMPQVRVLLQAANRGHVATFQRAIEASRRDIVILSDQDDLWVDNRVEFMREATPRDGLLATNLVAFGAPTASLCRSTLLRAEWDEQLVRNMIGMMTGRRAYYGCAMSMGRGFVDRALPIPAFATSHDLWFAQLAIVTKSLKHGEMTTVARRIHGRNVSAPRRRRLDTVALSRWQMLRGLAVGLARTSATKQS